MKLNKIIALCIAALILALAPVIASEIHRSKPIMIETELSDSDIISKVELSRGSLRFKTPNDVAAELTSKDIEENTPSKSDYHLNEQSPSYVFLDYTRHIKRDEVMDLMNIHPELWRISDKCGEEVRNKFIEPHFFISESGNHEYADFCMFRFEYGSKYSPHYISIRIAPSPVKWRFTSSLEWGHEKLLPIRLEYGALDSRIGNMDISVLQTDTGFSSFFNIKNASYEISAHGITQQEFIELLISIYEAPHPNNENVIDYIFTMPPREKKSERDNLVDLLREVYGNDGILYLSEADVYCYVRPTYRDSSGEPTIEPLVLDPNEKFYEGALISCEPSKPVYNVGERISIKTTISTGAQIRDAQRGCRLDMSVDGKWHLIRYIDHWTSSSPCTDGFESEINGYSLVGSLSGSLYKYVLDTNQFSFFEPDERRKIDLYAGHYRFVTWLDDDISGERYTVCCEFDVK